MTKTYLGSPPAEFTIPVTRGTDRSFTLRRLSTDGDPVNWDAELWVDVDIDPTAPTRVMATVTDEYAAFRLESDAICDRVTNRTTWRVIMSVPGATEDDESAETPVAVGGFERHDGRA